MLRKIIFGIASLLAVAGMTAQTRFGDAVEEILRRNSSASQLDAESSAELEQMKGENALENPEVEFSHRWGSAGAGNRWDVGISQGFQWPGVYSARSETARRTETALRLKSEARRQELRTEIGTALVEYVAALKTLELDRMLSARFDSVMHYSQRAYEAGELPVHLYNRCRLEKLSLRRQLTAAKEQLEAAKGKLASYCDAGADKADIGVIVAGVTEFPADYRDLRPLDWYLEQESGNNAEAMYSEAMARSMGSAERAARMERLPEFSVGYVHEYEAGERFNGVKAGVSIPIFGSKGKEKSAAASRRGYELASASSRTAERTRIESEYARAKTLLTEMKEYEEILNEDNSALMLQKAFMAGEITVMDYLRELNFNAESRRALIEISTDYYTLALQLARHTK